VGTFGAQVKIRLWPIPRIQRRQRTGVEILPRLHVRQISLLCQEPGQEQPWLFCLPPPSKHGGLVVSAWLQASLLPLLPLLGGEVLSEVTAAISMCQYSQGLDWLQPSLACLPECQTSNNCLLDSSNSVPKTPGQNPASVHVI
jgi:hypothetical protein